MVLEVHQVKFKFAELAFLAFFNYQIFSFNYISNFTEYF
ncbi:MAG: hypothetical protein MRERC_3c029 [Mycoplasmataceae bacterium RC_NB112A]|nr:MAG: hypothetical protein MRERC_3c029 [Mycoplasmataceae bacterium RC_NB112A]